MTLMNEQGVPAELAASRTFGQTPACARRMGAILGVLLGLAWSPSAKAEPPDDSLLNYAVLIQHTAPQDVTAGAGIYLGRGVFITAAHVAGRTWITWPKIASNGQEFPTKTLKEGSFEGTDITLLAVEEDLLPMRFRLRRMRLCDRPPFPGEDVVTIVPGSAVRSQVLAPARLPANLRRFATAISEVAQTGNSGSGVFDIRQRCLLGIMSRKLSTSRHQRGSPKSDIEDIGKYFVPAAEIAAFLPAGLQF